MPDPRTNADDYYDRWADDGDRALTILADGCDFPPSLEVFEHGLELVRERAHGPIEAARYARALADSYEVRPAPDNGPCPHDLWLIGKTGRRRRDVKVCEVCDCAELMPVVAEFRSL